MKKSYIILLPLLMLLSCTDKEALMIFDEVESYIHVEPDELLKFWKTWTVPDSGDAKGVHVIRCFIQWPLTRTGRLLPMNLS